MPTGSCETQPSRMLSPGMCAVLFATLSAACSPAADDYSFLKVGEGSGGASAGSGGAVAGGGGGVAAATAHPTGGIGSGGFGGAATGGWSTGGVATGGIAPAVTGGAPTGGAPPVAMGGTTPATGGSPVPPVNTDAGGQESVCATAERDESATAACPAGKVITSVTFASFGRPSGTCGSFVKAEDCHSESSRAVVEGACVGKSTCTIEATIDLFDNPCTGTDEKLAFEVVCAPG